MAERNLINDRDAENAERRLKRRFVQSVRVLELPQNQWSNAILDALGDFTARLTPQMTASVLLWSAFLILEDTRKETARIRDMLSADKDESDPKKKLDVEYKMFLEGQLTKYLHEYAALMHQTMELSEKAQTKAGKKGARFNLPPSLSGAMEFNAPVQFNMNPTPAPNAEASAEVPDNNGNGEAVQAVTELP